VTCRSAIRTIFGKKKATQRRLGKQSSFLKFLSFPLYDMAENFLSK